MIYLACPYSDPDPSIMRNRFFCANRTAAIIMSQGFHVFSPISQCHPIALEGCLPVDWEYWREYDKKILSICDEICVLTVDGWKQSKGIKGEIKLSVEMGITRTMIEYGSAIRRPIPYSIVTEFLK